MGFLFSSGMEIRPFKMSSHKRKKMEKMQAFRVLVLLAFASGPGDQSSWPLFKMAEQMNFYKLARKRGKPLIENSLVNCSTQEYGGTDAS